MLTSCSAASVAMVELLIKELLGMFKATGLYVEITIDILTKDIQYKMYIFKGKYDASFQMGQLFGRQIPCRISSGA
jgi:hypothetical protein